MSLHRSRAVHRLRVEPLEDRRMLSVAAPQVELFSAAPALFVENQGQWADESVRFMHQGDGATVAMTDEGLLLRVSRCEELDGQETPTQTLQFSAGFVGANTVAPEGRARSETVLNYFVGDEATWRAGVSGYEVVAYEGLYDGIDLLTWGQRDSLKYEFRVAPGADASRIAVCYQGVAGLSVAENGSLVVDLGGDWGTLTDDAPYVYQMIDGHKVDVAAEFVLIDATTYSFAVTGPYDPTAELVIDPDLAWSTYLGGSGDDRDYGTAVDASGNVLVVGMTDSTDFAGSTNAYGGGSRDTFVAKVGPSGSLAWATYLGSSGTDAGRGIALDAEGNALVTGVTNSTDFPKCNNTYQGGSLDVFVAKVMANGALDWSTYVGGSQADYSLGIAVDAEGNTLLTGETSSADFAGRTNTYYGGNYDAFVAKIGPGGAVAWATYLGGSGNDHGRAVAVNAEGDALVVGSTLSTDFAGAGNTSYGGEDTFVANVSPSGSVAWAIHVGGSGADRGCAIAVDVVGNVLVTGWSSSTDFAARTNAYHGGTRDAFVARVAPSGSLVWTTYLGGTAVDYAAGIATDAAGNILIAGSTSSTDFAECTNTSYGDYDAFVAEVTPSGSVDWARCLGGNDRDYGNSIAVDAEGNAFVVGDSWSADFAGRINSYHGAGDVFVAKIADTGLPKVLGDANGDGRVDDADAAILVLNWKQDARLRAEGDFNGDHRVDERDASILASHWHQAAPGTLLGDANVDGVVDAADAAILALNWKQDGKAWLDGDFNDDGRVDERDASILASHWGMSVEALTPPVAEGEPVGTDATLGDVTQPVAMATKIIGPVPRSMGAGNRRLLEAVQRDGGVAVETLAPSAIIGLRGSSEAETLRFPSRGRPPVGRPGLTTYARVYKAAAHDAVLSATAAEDGWLDARWAWSPEPEPTLPNRRLARPSIVDACTHETP